jgi:hypothetical protein
MVYYTPRTKPHMSKGSPIITLRVNEQLLSDLEDEIRNANFNRKDTPYTRSSWILKAVTEKISHLKRSRKEGKADAAKKKLKKRFDTDNKFIKNSALWTAPPSPT